MARRPTALFDFARQGLGIYTNSRRARFGRRGLRDGGIGGFQPFLPLGTADAKLLASLPDGPDGATQGEHQ
jgi:hypothetical protein